MSTIKAVVRNGRIETEEPLRLPEGTRLLITAPVAASEDDEGDSAADRAAWLEWADSLEPLIFTEDERAAWEAARKARKSWEQEHFDEYATKLRKSWE